MGLDVGLVLSDESHYKPFICAICSDVADVDDCFVTDKCSHPFCKSCIIDWFSEKDQQQPGESSALESCNCPKCNADITLPPSNPTGKDEEPASRTNKNTGEATSAGVTEEHISNNKDADLKIHAKLLSEAQPLAHMVMSRIKVKCPYQHESDNGESCKWEGYYGDLRDHLKDAGHNDLLPNTDILNTSLPSSHDQTDTNNNNSHKKKERKNAIPSSSSSQALNSKVNSSQPSSEGDDNKNIISKSNNRSKERLKGDDHKVHDNKNTQRRRGSISSNNSETNENLASKYAKEIEAIKDKGNAAFADGKYREARELFTKGLLIMKRQISGSNSNGDNCGGSEKNMTKTEKHMYASLYCNRAAAYLREGSYEKCIADCDTSLELNPDYGKAFLRKAKAQIEIGRFVDAISTLQDGTSCNPQSKSLGLELQRLTKLNDHIRKVDKFISKGDFRSAKDTIDLLPEDFLEMKHLLILSARTDIGLGLTETALEKCASILRKDSCNADALAIEGQVLYLVGDFDEGIEALTESLTFDPDNESTKDILRKCRRGQKAVQEGRTALGKGRYKRAVEQYTIAVEESLLLPKKAPLFSLLHAERAEALLGSKQHYEALTDCMSALESRADNISAWVTKSEVNHALGRHQEARDELAAAKRTSWGARSEEIKVAYNKADFELRIQQVDVELRNMVASVDNVARSAKTGPPSSSAAGQDPETGNNTRKKRSSKTGGRRGSEGDADSGRQRRKKIERSGCGIPVGNDEGNRRSANNNGKPSMRRQTTGDGEGDRRPSTDKAIVRRQMTAEGNRRSMSDFSTNKRENKPTRIPPRRNTGDSKDKKDDHQAPKVRPKRSTVIASTASPIPTNTGEITSKTSKRRSSVF